MEVYNRIIGSIFKEIENKGAKMWNYSSSDAWSGQNDKEFITLKDTHTELGTTPCKSVCAFCVTSSTALVEKDDITLLGKDIKDLDSLSDFARIVIVRLNEDAKSDNLSRTLRDIEYSKYHVFPKGYMTKMSSDPQKEQIRVSKEAIKYGICFRTVGANYIKKIKEFPEVAAVKVIFITDEDADYENLYKLAKQAEAITTDINHLN